MHLKQLFFEKNILRAVWNSFVMSGFTTLYVIVVASMSAYIISRFKFKGKNLLMALILTVAMFPQMIISDRCSICTILLENWIPTGYVWRIHLLLCQVQYGLWWHISNRFLLHWRRQRRLMDVLPGELYGELFSNCSTGSIYNCDYDFYFSMERISSFMYHEQ